MLKDEIEIRMLGGGPLDGVKIKVDPSAWRLAATEKVDEGRTAVYERDGVTEKFVFVGFFSSKEELDD